MRPIITKSTNVEIGTDKGGEKQSKRKTSSLVGTTGRINPDLKVFLFFFPGYGRIFYLLSNQDKFGQIRFL